MKREYFTVKVERHGKEITIKMPVELKPATDEEKTSLEELKFVLADTLEERFGPQNTK